MVSYKVSKSSRPLGFIFPLYCRLCEWIQWEHERRVKSARELFQSSPDTAVQERMDVVGNVSVNPKLLCIFILLKMHEDLNKAADITQTDLPNKSHSFLIGQEGFLNVCSWYQFIVTWQAYMI